MKKYLLVFLSFICLFLLTSCEVDDNGNMSLSDFGWIIVIWFVIFFIVILAKAAKKKKEQEREHLLSEINNQLSEYRKEQEKKEQENKAKYASIAKEYQNCDSMDIEVKGIFARSRLAKETVPSLTVNDNIKLRKEPTNEYDPYAVKVMYERIHLGYVPASESQFVTKLINHKSIKKVVVKFAGDSELEPWDKPDPYLILTIYYQE